MTWFRDFTGPLWAMFSGNLLMLLAIICYIAWWTASNGDVTDGRWGVLVSAVLLFGIVAILAMVAGIMSLSPGGGGAGVPLLLPGTVMCFFLFLAVTKIGFHREVTSELLWITVWAALEWAAICAMRGCGRFNAALSVTLLVLVVLATAAGLVCYVAHYNLDEPSRFINGLIPLFVDGGVVLLFLALTAASHEEK